MCVLVWFVVCVVGWGEFVVCGKVGSCVGCAWARMLCGVCGGWRAGGWVDGWYLVACGVAGVWRVVDEVGGAGGGVA